MVNLQVGFMIDGFGTLYLAKQGKVNQTISTIWLALAILDELCDSLWI